MDESCFEMFKSFWLPTRSTFQEAMSGRHVPGSVLRVALLHDLCKQSRPCLTSTGNNSTPTIQYLLSHALKSLGIEEVTVAVKRPMSIFQCLDLGSQGPHLSFNASVLQRTLLLLDLLTQCA